MPLLTHRFVLAAGLMLLAGSAAAEDFLPTSNQAALARGYDLPVLGNAHTLAPGASVTGLTLDLTTEYFAGSKTTEAVSLDGESQLYTLRYRRGFGQGLEWSVELPLLLQGGGFMDSSIENWHDTFGLPNGGRENAPRNAYGYSYQRNGQTALDVPDSHDGLADARLGIGWQLSHDTALRAEVKLPTGDDAKLSGGALGIALWADGDRNFAGDRGVWSVSVGGSLNDKTEVLPDQSRRWVGFAGTGLRYRLWQPLSVFAQVYWHTKLYEDSELKPFRQGLQLTFGTRIHASPHLEFDLGFQEDPIVASSPDFSVHVGVRYR